jgi:opacity protein-like surface antigen
MRKLWFFAPLLLCIPAAHAQNAVDLNLGFGGVWDSANKTGIDDFTLAPCTSSTVICDTTPKLSGFTLGFGGDVMFKQHFGAGVEYSVQPSRQTYATGTLNGSLDGGTLQSRQSFIDVNGIYEPIINKRFIVQLQGGIGDARTSLAVSSSGCVATVCSTSTEAIGNANHFQLHLGAGVQVAITEHIFIRPQFDYRYVPGLNNQFGSNNVPAFTVWLGYHWGGQQ